jgi:polar amino acid transport system substrate-binding protein
MHRPTTRRYTALSAIAIGSVGALLFAGCSTASETTTDTESTPAATSSVEVNEEARALLPASILDSGVLRVAVDPTVGAPASYLDEETNEVTGSDPAMSAVLAQALGLELESVQISFASLISGLQADRADIAMSSMGDTAERQESVDFVDYVSGGLTLQVAAGNPAGITSYDELCGHSVGVTPGSYNETVVTEKSAACEEAGNPAVDIVTFPDGANVLSALQSGRIEASSTDMQIGAYSAAQNPDVFEIPEGADLVLGNIGVVIPKGEDDLTEAIRLAMTGLFESGVYADTLDEWGISDLGLDAITVNQAIVE